MRKVLATIAIVWVAGVAILGTLLAVSGGTPCREVTDDGSATGGLLAGSCVGGSPPHRGAWLVALVVWTVAAGAALVIAALWGGGERNGGRGTMSAAATAPSPQGEGRSVPQG